jgi:hypothetical protein
MPSRLIAETELYRPVCDFLQTQGYTVRGEVAHCDLVAVKGEELIVVELKRHLSVELLTQAIERQALTESVYVAIPRPANKGRWLAREGGTLKLLRRLELGLLFVALTGRAPQVEIIQQPLPHERRRRPRGTRALLEEFHRRSGDYNPGGSTRRKLITAYRENAIQIACLLAEHGPLTPRALRTLETGPKTLAILSRNVYGWFARVTRGTYSLTDQGRTELTQYPGLVARFRAQGAATSVDR